MNKTDPTQRFRVIVAYDFSDPAALALERGIGGDEFVMLLPETDESAAMRLAERLRANRTMVAVVAGESPSCRFRSASPPRPKRTRSTP
jgi:hypothetical protein